MRSANIQPQCMVIFSKSTGEIKETIVGRSNALMRGYIFQNGLKKSESAIIFGLADGIIKYAFSGTGDFPEQFSSYEGENKIEAVCEGLLSVMREDWEKSHPDIDWDEELK